MNDSITLSICTLGRNDNYEPDFLYRLTTSVNYTASKLKEIGRLNEVEILITDWGSSTPLSEVVKFSAEGASITRFIFVPASLILSINNGIDEFNTHVASNIAIRRAKGRFIIACGADVFLPHSSIKTLLDILSGNILTPFDIEQTYFLIPRFHIPFEYIRWQPDIDEIDRIISTHTMAFDKDCYLASGGAAGALLASSKMYNKLGGFFYKYSGYGYSDYDAMEIFSRYHSYADTMSFGIFSYHMGHSKNSVAQKERLRVHKLKFIEIRPLSWKECEPNDWGMADKIFDFQIPKTGAPDYLMRTVRNDFLDQTTLNTIGNMDIKKIVLRTITSLNYTKKDICPTGKQIQNLDAMYILSWWATHSPPSSFLVCPFDIRAAAAISTAGSLCTDIYAILNQEGVIKLKDSWASHANNLQHFFKHKGYLRVVNGPIKTAIERLLNSMIRKPSFDLILFQLHKLDDSWQNVLSQAWERLTPGGAIVFCEDSAQIFNIQWDKIKGIIGISAQYIKFTDCNAGVVIRLKNLDGCEAITTSLELYNGRKLSCLDIYLYWLNKLFDKFTHKIFGLYSRFVHWTLKN